MSSEENGEIDEIITMQDVLAEQEEMTRDADAGEWTNEPVAILTPSFCQFLEAVMPKTVRINLVTLIDKHCIHARPVPTSLV